MVMKSLREPAVAQASIQRPDQKQHISKFKSYISLGTFAYTPPHQSMLPKNERKKSRNVVTAVANVSANTRPEFAKELFISDKRPIILFDGVCNLCNGGVNFMLDWDTKGVCRFAALQSPAGKALLQRSNRSPNDISSIVLVEENTSYIKSEAILRTALRLNIPFPVLASLGLLFPLGFRDFTYDTIADNRYNFFGKSGQCRLSDARFADRFVE